MITKEEFIAAWNKYPPSKIERLFYKIFSRSEGNGPWFIFFILIVPFLIGYIGTISGWERSLVGNSTYVFSVLLILCVVPGLFVWIFHNRRIKKIIKELNCTLEEYDNAVNEWGKYIK